MSIRTSLLTVAAALCVLPHTLQADSVFNFDSDPTAFYSTIGFVDVNNGIAAAFYPGPGGLSTFYVDPNGYNVGNYDYMYPLRTLSGNALSGGAVYVPDGVSEPTFGISFSTELTSIRFNFAAYNGGFPQGGSQITVQAYNNGVLVGSETVIGYQPIQDGPTPSYHAADEGVAGFIGAPFNEVVISGTQEFYQYPLQVDNIDVSAAPEPLGLTAFGLSLVAAAIVSRRRRRSWFKHGALALTVICGGLFSSTAKASNITTVGFDFSGFSPSDTFTGLTVEGEGVFSFAAGLTTVTTADVTNFAYIEYLNFDNCYMQNCYVGVVDGVAIKASNILESFTLNSLDATLDASGNVIELGITTTGTIPVSAGFGSFYPPTLFSFLDLDAFAQFGGLNLEGDIDIVNVTTTPEPAFIGLFAGVLVLAGLAVRSRSRS